jgi:hypothetical protein
MDGERPERHKIEAALSHWARRKIATGKVAETKDEFDRAATLGGVRDQHHHVGTMLAGLRSTQRQGSGWDAACGFNRE